jgi:hypothetical protein
MREGGGALEQLPGGMAEEVDGVLDPAGAGDRPRVDGESKRDRQLLVVEALGPLRELDAALEQSARA